jgi:hypothetical protein
MLAALVLLLDAPHPVPSATVRTHDLTKLTHMQALQLAGKSVRYHVQLDTPLDVCRQYVIAGCRTPDAVERSVYFQGDQIIGEDEVDVQVEGTLRVIHHNAWQQVPGWTELRVMDARRIR